LKKIFFFLNYNKKVFSKHHFWNLFWYEYPFFKNFKKHEEGQTKLIFPYKILDKSDAIIKKLRLKKKIYKKSTAKKKINIFAIENGSQDKEKDKKIQKMICKG